MLRRRGVGLALVVVLLCWLAPPASAIALNSREQRLLRIMNDVRASHGLPRLRLTPRLERAARAHTVSMLRTGQFTHGAFDRRLAAFGVGGRVVGENLAWGVGYLGSPRAVVRAWLASPDHRANLLRPRFRRVGVAALRGRFNGYAKAVVVTADFAGR